MPTFTVTDTGDAADDTGTGGGAGTGTLRQAINFANANPGTTVSFAVSGTIALAGELPAVTSSMTIDGAGQNVIIDGGGSYRPFLVGDGTTPGVTDILRLANLTVANGLAKPGEGGDGSAQLGGPLAARGGAAVVASNGALSVDNVTFSGNRTAEKSLSPRELRDPANRGFGGAGGAFGGALFIQAGGHLTVEGDTTETGGTIGRTLGTAFFFQGVNGVPTTLGFGSGDQTIADDISDYTGRYGQNPNGGTDPVDQGGALTLEKAGSGTLTLSAINNYSGGTLLDGGTLELGKDYVGFGGNGSKPIAAATGPVPRTGLAFAGTGPITFGAGPQTLRLDLVAGGTTTVFKGTLADLGVGDSIDLRGLVFTDAATANAITALGPDSSVLSVSSGNTKEEFLLSNPETLNFAAASDGAGGTLVTALPPAGGGGATAGATLAFDPSASFYFNFDPGFYARDPGVGYAALTGTVNDPSGVAGIEVYATSAAGRPIDIGSASVNADGTWVVFDVAGTTTQTGFYAVETGGDGNTVTAQSNYDLILNVAGQPYSDEQDNYDADGNFLGQILFNGPDPHHPFKAFSVYETSQYQALPNGGSSYTYSGGTAFEGTGVSSSTDTYGPRGALLFQVAENTDGSHTITGVADRQRLHSIANDTFTGSGTSDRFVFTPGFGGDTIENFAAFGPAHDILSVPRSDFATIADVLHNTAQQGADAVITDPVSGDTITLAGVTKAELIAHKQDFTLHA